MHDAFAWIGLVGFLWLVVFQLLLASGAPIGALAWGGAQRVLSTPRRWASLAASIHALLGVWSMARALELAPGPDPTVLLWGFCGLFFLSALANALSSSKVERAHGVPLTIVLSASSGIVAAF